MLKEKHYICAWKQNIYLKMTIPEQYRCNPYEISPSGDPFFADKRNVEKLDRILNDKEAMEDSDVELKSPQDIERYLGLI